MAFRSPRGQWVNGGSRWVSHPSLLCGQSARRGNALSKAGFLSQWQHKHCILGSESFMSRDIRSDRCDFKVCTDLEKCLTLTAVLKSLDFSFCLENGIFSWKKCFNYSNDLEKKKKSQVAQKGSIILSRTLSETVKSDLIFPFSFNLVTTKHTFTCAVHASCRDYATCRA